MNVFLSILAAGTLFAAQGMAHAQPAPTEGHHAATTAMEHQGHAGHKPASSPDDTASRDPVSRDSVIRAYQRVNEQMHADMAIEFTGDADVDFMRGMIPHHQAAVDMARVALEHGKDPEVRKMAEALIATQEKEIQAMRDWLARKGK